MTAESVKTKVNGQAIRTAKQEQIITLHTQQPTASMREIARQSDSDTSYVIEVLQRYGLIQQNIKDYKSNRADVFAGLQHRLIKSITDEDIKKAPLGSRVLAVAQLYDKERLENDLSTSNSAVIADIALLKGLKSNSRLLKLKSNSSAE
jgi:hypothetical protein